MALLRFADDSILSSPQLIAQYLATLNIQFRQYPQPDISGLDQLLLQDYLNEDEKQQILQQYNHQFQSLRQEAGYFWQDVFHLHPGSSNLYAFILNFGRCHFHSGSEALFMLAGEAFFGFVQSDGVQIQLLIQPQDYLHIPAQIAHWFSPTSALDCKMIRYFSTIESWVPQYTETTVVNAFAR